MSAENFPMYAHCLWPGQKAKQLIKQKRLLFGTVDCFLLWRLTGGTNHFTDATNASRTMLFNIATNKWDKQILDILKIPSHILYNWS